MVGLTDTMDSVAREQLANERYTDFLLKQYEEVSIPVIPDIGNYITIYPLTDGEVCIRVHQNGSWAANALTQDLAFVVATRILQCIGAEPYYPPHEEQDDEPSDA